MSACIKGQKDLKSMQLKFLEKQEKQIPSQAEGEKIKIRAEINVIEPTKKKIQRINETKSWLFEQNK
jgi:ribosomal protein L19